MTQPDGAFSEEAASVEIVDDTEEVEAPWEEDDDPQRFAGEFLDVDPAAEQTGE